MRARPVHDGCQLCECTTPAFTCVVTEPVAGASFNGRRTRDCRGRTEVVALVVTAERLRGTLHGSAARQREHKPHWGGGEERIQAPVLHSWGPGPPPPGRALAAKQKGCVCVVCVFGPHQDCGFFHDCHCLKAHWMEWGRVFHSSEGLQRN